MPGDVKLDGGKLARLDAMVSTLQQRWGAAVIHQGYAATPRPKVSTGFASLDAALDGGVPQGQTTEILGRPTSGMTTLVYKIIASAQSASAFGIYIDLDCTFDPDYAARSGLALERLFLARPDTNIQALDIARDLLASGSVAVIALDMGQLQPESNGLRRLTNALSRSGCVVVLLLTLPAIVQPPISTSAAVRLLVERRGWLERQSDIRGYMVCVTVLKHPTITHRQVNMEIDFDDNIAGEPR